MRYYNLHKFKLVKKDFKLETGNLKKVCVKYEEDFPKDFLKNGHELVLINDFLFNVHKVFVPESLEKLEFLALVGEYENPTAKHYTDLADSISDFLPRFMCWHQGDSFEILEFLKGKKFDDTVLTYFRALEFSTLKVIKNRNTLEPLIGPVIYLDEKNFIKRIDFHCNKAMV